MFESSCSAAGGMTVNNFKTPHVLLQRSHEPCVSTAGDLALAAYLLHPEKQSHETQSYTTFGRTAYLQCGLQTSFRRAAFPPLSIFGQENKIYVVAEV